MELKILYDKSLNLGEGPIWDPRVSILYFVDILGKSLFCHHYEKNKTDILYFDEFISCVALTGNINNLLIALESGIYRFDVSTGKKTFIIQPEKSENFRFNDGAVTPWGTWLLGSMNNLNNGDNAPLLPDACLYEISEYGANPILESVTIPNGIVFEGNSVYFIDSKINSVRKFQHQDNSFIDEKIIFQFEGPGSLDGMCLSKSRKLYIANWGGSQILVFDLNSGQIIENISVPAINPTSCTFGGPQMNELFITTSNRDEKSPTRIAGVYRILVPDIGYEEPILNW